MEFCYGDVCRMRFIRKPERGAWVAVRDDLVLGMTEEEIKIILRNKFLDVQVWFADLDDSDARSPGKKLVKKAVGAKGRWLNPHYLCWVMGTAKALAEHGKRAESECWADYVNQFLRNEDVLTRIKELFTPKEVKGSLYPGVEEFYSLLPADKFYVTKNIEEVARAYANVLGFAGFFSEVEDKSRLVENFILDRPGILRYGVSGDSLEDEQMVDVLNFYYRKRKIDQPTTLYRADKPTREKMNPRFQVQIGKDRSGLVELLKS